MTSMMSRITKAEGTKEFCEIMNSFTKGPDVTFNVRYVLLEFTGSHNSMFRIGGTFLCDHIDPNYYSKWYEEFYQDHKNKFPVESVTIYVNDSLPLSFLELFTKYFSQIAPGNNIPLTIYSNDNDSEDMEAALTATHRGWNIVKYKITDSIICEKIYNRFSVYLYDEKREYVNKPFEKIIETMTQLHHLAE